MTTFKRFSHFKNILLTSNFRRILGVSVSIFFIVGCQKVSYTPAEVQNIVQKTPAADCNVEPTVFEVPSKAVVLQEFLMTFNRDNVRWRLTHNGERVFFDGPVVKVTLDKIGSYTGLVTGDDGCGNVETREFEILVEDAPATTTTTTLPPTTTTTMPPTTTTTTLPPTTTTTMPPTTTTTSTTTSTTTTTLPAPVISSGICTDHQPLTACMNCENPGIPVWNPSTKAEKLAQMMFMSCGIQNASDPGSYSPTQHDIYEIRSKLQACTAEALPETPLKKDELVTINKMLDKNDASMRNKIYRGLYYRPPFTDHFETYFGVETQTIRQILCYDASSSGLNGFDYTSEYAKACGGGGEGDSCGRWERDPAAQARWNAVQNIRAQLRDCVNRSLHLPPIQPPTQPICYWRTFEGYYQLGGASEFASMQSNGYDHISVEYKNACYNPQNLSTLPVITSGLVKISGYFCK